MHILAKKKCKEKQRSKYHKSQDRGYIQQEKLWDVTQRAMQGASGMSSACHI